MVSDLHVEVQLEVVLQAELHESPKGPPVPPSQAVLPCPHEDDSLPRGESSGVTEGAAPHVLQVGVRWPLPACSAGTSSWQDFWSVLMVP